MIYVVGDVHGYYKKLISLIEKMPLTSEDQIVFTGDYIDRGPDSKKVVEYLIDLGGKFNCVYLRGNHEQMLLDAIHDSLDFSMWMQNGGKTTVKNYRSNPHNFPARHMEFYKKTRLTYETDQYFFVHAGIDPFKEMPDQTADDYLWIRDVFLFNPDLPTDKTIVFGHTPRNVIGSPHDGKDRICVDNGVTFGYPLMGIRLDDKTEFFSD